MEKLKYTTILITSIAALFKGMEWPYASYLLMSSVLIIIIYCLIKIFKS